MPSNGDTAVWRYMDFPKYVSLLATGTLWFARADTVEDRFEGSTTHSNQRWLAEVVKDSTNGREMIATMQAMTRAMVTNTAISCWHMGEHESAAMWDLYLRSRNGVAVRSTLRRLKASFPEANASGVGRGADGRANALAVHMGAMKYIDYKTESIPPGNLVHPFLFKRKSYEHERELRALVFDLPIDGRGSVALEESWCPGGGVQVPIDINQLVESVYVAPLADAWFRDTVRAVTERWGFSFEVRQSSLNEDPLY